ncbi:GNAT superfamily N-acetyltransferase [Inhella inkyongensis]|uniref:GNAT superfamily N-acetyltransferase n=1 Tax=Inhella inkyongensis TaxID=392593 RepID=A0A840S5F9_9BURK|nr:GNAT family N-acetyltransferase [Inhella inkyongensis]MBB5205625.1 GNAT superfamily N-acetyltransferase [Inhella inkyongensis]
MKLRPMHASDAAAVLAIQQAAYGPHFHEDWTVLGAKLALYPQGCWVAQAEAQVGAYLFSHPARLGQPLALHGALTLLPADPDCYYLHDLAIHPDWQGRGLGTQLRQCFDTLATQAGQRVRALVAVQNSRAFWERQGFDQATPLSPAAQQALAAYGPDAVALHGQAPSSR